MQQYIKEENDKFTNINNSSLSISIGCVPSIDLAISNSRTQNSQYNKQQATSKSTGEFAHILCACKKSQYNVRNCKSGRHNRRHTFQHHNTRYKPSLTNIQYYDLKVKEKRTERLKLHLLINKIGYLVLLIFIKIQVTNICRWIQGMITIPVLISHIVKILTKLIQVSICKTKWFYPRSLHDKPKNQGL